MFFIDIAVPRDIDPKVNDVDNVYLYDIDDLNGVVATNLEERQIEAEQAEAIVVEEMAGFQRWLDSLEVTPTIVSIRRRPRDPPGGAGQGAPALGTSDPKKRKVVEALTSSIVNKMLHSPIASLKRETDGRSPWRW